MKKFLSLALTAALTMTAFTACSTGKKEEKVSVTLTQNKVEIVEQLEAAAKAFNESQSKIEVKVLGVPGTDYDGNLQTQFAADPSKAPTIFTASGGAEFERFAQFMLPLADTESAKAISPGLEKGAMKDGELLGLPTTIEGFGLVYNKSIFKEAGVEAESIKTIDDLVDACGKLEGVSGVEKAVGFAKESYFSFMHPWNWAFAAMDDYKSVIEKINSGEIKFEDVQEIKDFADSLEKLKAHTNLAKDTYDEQVAGFSTGKYAIIHQGNWAVGIINDYDVDFEYGMLPLPFDGIDGLSVGVANYWRVNKHADEKQQAAAKEFLDWLITNSEGQKHYIDEFKFIPPYKNASTQSLDPLAQEVSKYASEGKTVPWTFIDFPSGAHLDFAVQVEKYFADQITKDELVVELGKVWVQASK